MASSNVKVSQIREVIQKAYGLELSSAQIKSVSKSAKARIRMCETTEVGDYMGKIGGQAFYLQSNEELEAGVIKRQGVATFTSEELENLARFGDFVAIDPTFTPLTSDWNVIPLTVVDNERKIRSGGLIFTCNLKSHVFLWILRLLLLVLPSKDVIRTLCSDDDTGLEGAFNILRESEDGVEPDSAANVKMSYDILSLVSSVNHSIRFAMGME